MADEELKKAFQDLQFKTNETKGLIAQGEITKKLNAQVSGFSVGPFLSCFSNVMQCRDLHYLKHVHVHNE
ncbi:unnamed protein product [Haemonchus placei]|uniref:Prefoldin subunit 6 n=1 Tax=Haemonchus placei TaxID=6290 RepID=A0A0N4VTT8_HAEPC|nr:unnamed protein product [Haemonchus placei]